jgi:hypothetical protein
MQVFSGIASLPVIVVLLLCKCLHLLLRKCALFLIVVFMSSYDWALIICCAKEVTQNNVMRADSYTY